MKKLFVFAVTAVLLSSCGGDKSPFDQKVSEICSDIENFNPEEAASVENLITKMAEMEGIMESEGKTMEQFQESMASQCPEGLLKMQDLLNMAQ